MRILVLDDEKAYAELVADRVHALLQTRNVPHTVDVCTDSAAFRTDAPVYDMAFLDVAMQPPDGIEVAQNADGKWIELTVECKVAGITALTCENGARNTPLTRGGLLRTTKENAAHHGVGVKSISRIAKKHGGQCDWNWDENKKYSPPTLCLSGDSGI